MPREHDEKMRRFQAAGLYVVATRAQCAGRETLEVVRAVLDRGVGLVQLREKEADGPALIRLAAAARRLTAQAGALLIVNDRLDVAQAVGADGVHLGQDDLPIDVARARAPNMILGASTHSAAEAQAAERLGASYVNVGPLFPTQTKSVAPEACLGVDGMRAVAACVSIPFTVMGGIKKRHVADLVAAGARTLAVVTAVTAAPDPGRAAAELLSTIRAAQARRHDGSN